MAFAKRWTPSVSCAFGQPKLRRINPSPTPFPKNCPLVSATPCFLQRLPISWQASSYGLMSTQAKYVASIGVNVACRSPEQLTEQGPVLTQIGEQAVQPVVTFIIRCPGCRKCENVSAVYTIAFQKAAEHGQGVRIPANGGCLLQARHIKGFTRGNEGNGVFSRFRQAEDGGEFLWRVDKIRMDFVLKSRRALYRLSNTTSAQS